nr:DPP IV N-terminal domain-containing protein [Pseudomaricurvus alkylphenolicus]
MLTRLDANNYTVVSGQQALSCDLSAAKCDKVSAPEGVDPTSVPSPNGKYAVFSRDFNLWLRDNVSGEERALTTDGERSWGYGKTPESSAHEITMRRYGVKNPVGILWSPDGSKFISYQLDERHVPEMHLVQSIPEDGSYRPKLHSYHFDLVGDQPSLAKYFIYDIEKGTRTELDYPALPSTLMPALAKGHITWSADGQQLYMLDEQSDNGFLKFSFVDSSTGQVRMLIEERSETVIFANAQFSSQPNVRVLENGDVIWFSEKSGWGHLYLLDGKTGEEKYALTSGDWLVRDILYVNEAAGELLVSGSGENKSEDVLFNKLYRVKLDGSGKKLLTPEAGHHNLKSYSALMARWGDYMPHVISPSGKYFVDYLTYPDQVGSWTLRDSNGKAIVELAKEDVSQLPEFTKPESFTVKSADGKYDLYGVILKPRDFDNNKRYPVIEFYYPGPQMAWAPKAFVSAFPPGSLAGDAQALAQLGFVVVMMDGRGTPWRSKAFMDLSYNNMDKVGYMEDHVNGIKELAKTRPWMDIDRVGMFGSSGGGFATAHALMDYPDFYKVGVSSAGNHEQRSYIRTWGEIFHGKLDKVDYDKVFVGKNAANLKGKLLLAHGEMDENVHPAMTMRVADALIKAGKQFDMLMMPNVEHLIMGKPYFQRLTQRYFLEHLMGAELPHDVDMGLSTEQ